MIGKGRGSRYVQGLTRYNIQNHSVQINSRWNGKIAGDVLFGKMDVIEGDYESILSESKFFNGFRIMEGGRGKWWGGEKRKRNILKKMVNRLLVRIRLKTRKTEEGVDCFPGLKDGRWEAFLPDFLPYV